MSGFDTEHTSRLWRWLTTASPDGYWFSRPMWPHFIAAAGLVTIIVVVVLVGR